MRGAAFFLILALIDTGSVLAQKAAACGGEERWDVKTLADSDASKIRTTPVDTTVAEMVAQPRPAGVNATLPRTGTVETTTYRLTATLTLYKREADQDYHLVLEDGDDTMIAEIPNPDCAPNSTVLSQIKNAREEFDKEFRVSSDKHATKISVTVTGIGFFDIVHGGAGQIGHAENNIEIHPVLDIKFNGPKPPEFEAPTTTTAAAEVRTAAYEPGIGLLWWVIAITMTILYVVAIRGTVGTLRRSNHWSLAEALQDSDGKPSSSRMIAFLGLCILMVLYMGIGYVAIWRLLNNQPLPDVNAFLLTGLSLFAPYAFNQLKQFALGMASGLSGGGASANNAAGTRQRSTPKVIGISPSSVSANTSTQITVTGVGFDPKATVWVTTNAAPVVIAQPVVTPIQIQFAVTMPASAAAYNAVVHVMNPDGAEATSTFQVTQ
jgi:hypothetical protein